MDNQYTQSTILKCSAVNQTVNIHEVDNSISLNPKIRLEFLLGILPKAWVTLSQY